MERTVKHQHPQNTQVDHPLLLRTDTAPCGWQRICIPAAAN
jgi:hypothetical protein